MKFFTIQYLRQYRIQMRNFCCFRCWKRAHRILQSCMRGAFILQIVHLYFGRHIHAHAPKKNLKICWAHHEQLGDQISSQLLFGCGAPDSKQRFGKFRVRRRIILQFYFCKINASLCLNSYGLGCRSC